MPELNRIETDSITIRLSELFDRESAALPFNWRDAAFPETPQQRTYTDEDPTHPGYLRTGCNCLNCMEVRAESRQRFYTTYPDSESSPTTEELLASRREQEALNTPWQGPTIPKSLEMEIARGDSLRITFNGVILATASVKGISYTARTFIQKEIDKLTIWPGPGKDLDRDRQAAANRIIQDFHKNYEPSF